MSTLYVNLAGATIRKASRRLVVSHRDGVVQSVRLRDVTRVVIVGPVLVTQPAILALMEHGIETTFLSGSGRPRARLSPMEGKNVFLRVAQVRQHDHMPFRLEVARRIVAGKMRNGRRVLQLWARLRRDLDLSEPLADLDRLRRKAQDQETIAALMGVEGDAAARYFRAYGSLFRGALRFETRTRRPPRDPVNSLLSLGYTLLCTEATGAVASHGLDPFVGFLHDLDYGRPSLALDLMEEFRHAVVDRFVLSAINHHAFQEDHFEPHANGAVLMKDEPRKKFFRLFEKVMTAEFVNHGAPTTFRRALQDQAAALARCVTSGDAYEPFVFY